MWSTRVLFIVLRRVVGVLLALELVYLGVANALVRSQVIKDAVASAEGFHLDYGRAYSLWPGHVWIEDFSLRVEDYNVQFEVAFDSAKVDISLSDLLFKRFRATRLEADGTRFRMRHRLIAVGEDAERVAAYPSIRGFADPPYYVGVRPPPIPDDEYDLWEVRVENVTARSSELWVMEQRFRGPAVARGGFVIRPARWVQVSGASLELASGQLTLGDHVVSERVRGRITCEIPDMHVQASEGIEVFREISTHLKLELAQGQLDFLDAYLGGPGSPRYSGPASWQVDVNIQRGVVQPGSQVSMLARPLTVHHELADITGDVMLSLGRLASAPDRLSVTLSAPRLTGARAQAKGPGPSLEGVEAGLRLDAADLSREAGPWSGQVALGKLHVPQLSWFPTQDVELNGEADGRATLARDEAGRLSGWAELSSPAVQVRHDSFSAQAKVHGKLVAARAAGARELEGASELALRLSNVQLRAGDKRSEPFAVALDGSGMRVAPGSSPAVRGAARVHVSSAQALLPLVVGEPLRELGTFALDLQAIEGSVNLELQRERLALQQIDARSGNLRLQGHLEQRERAQTGALLLSSGLLHVGVTLRGGKTELSPFVASDWLGRSGSSLRK